MEARVSVCGPWEDAGRSGDTAPFLLLPETPGVRKAAVLLTYPWDDSPLTQPGGVGGRSQT